MIYILRIIVAVILIVLGKYFVQGDLSPNFIAEGVSLIISFFLIDFVYELYRNRQSLKLFLQTKLFLSTTDIRLSIAYLFRIKIDGKYLLVKSRIRNSFQPVGGAFKTLPSSKKIFETLKVKSDRLIETEHGIAKGDLRVHVKGKNVTKFLDWFDSKKDREISPWREFCEELISTNILNWPEFRYIDYEFKGTIKSPIITLDSGGKGMFVFEVYDLLANDEQEPILRRLLNEGNTQKYIWVSDYLIQRLGHDEQAKEQIYEIAPHTKYAQNMKWSK